AVTLVRAEAVAVAVDVRLAAAGRRRVAAAAVASSGPLAVRRRGRRRRAGRARRPVASADAGRIPSAAPTGAARTTRRGRVVALTGGAARGKGEQDAERERGGTKHDAIVPIRRRVDTKAARAAGAALGCDDVVRPVRAA